VVVTGCVSVTLQCLQELSTSTHIHAGRMRPAAIAHHEPLQFSCIPSFLYSEFTLKFMDLD
jgi:hypothetical protein